MKNLLIILIVFASFSLSAQSNKSVIFNQGFGIVLYEYSDVNVYQSDVKYKASKGSFECIYQMRLEYSNFFAVSNTSIFMNKAKGVEFSPNFADFKIKIGYKFKSFKISIEHQCLHSIESRGYNDDDNRISGGYNRIKLTYNIID